MDEDSAIRVLHYYNPHLLWVEVKNHDTYTFRQVGLFGIVPRQASLVDGERVCTKSDRWDPRVNDVLEEFLETKHQIWFKSTYRLDDETNQTSIFRHQPHIFGEIYSVRKQDGVKKQLINCLDNTVYAYKSRKEFWEMLNEGKIRTILNKAQEDDVLQKIVCRLQAKATWNRKKEMFFKCLSSSQVAQFQESPCKLTVENLEKHKILTSKVTVESIKNLPVKEAKTSSKKKNYNFNSEDLTPVEFVEEVIKKFTIVENGDKVKQVKETKNVKTSSTRSVLSKITVYDEEINPQDSEDQTFDASFDSTESQRPLGRANTRKHNSKQDENKFAELMRLKDKFRPKNAHHIESCNVQEETLNYVQNEPNVQKLDQEESNYIEDVKMTEIDARSKYFNELEEYAEANSNSSPSFKTEERMVAYGPPTSRPQCLVPKLMVNKIDYTPTKQVKDEDTTWKGDKIDWDDDDEAGRSNFDECNEISKNLTSKFDDSNENDDNASKKVDKIFAMYRKPPLNNCNDKHSDFKNDKSNHTPLDLNDPKQYNDFIRSKQNFTETKLQDDANDAESVRSITNKSFKSSVDDNKDVDTVQKNTSKLLEKMRRRKVPNNSESLSSDDNSYKKQTQLDDDTQSTLDSSVEKMNLTNNIPKNSNFKSSNQDSDDDLEEIHAKLNSNHKPITIETRPIVETVKVKANVNPYKNLDGSKSIFVDNLIQPLLLAHAKNDNKILPQSSLRDVPFKIDIHNTLRNMQIKNPSRLQSVSWPYILRGHSMILISAANSGKTLGYLPAVCNLVLDYNFDFAGLGPVCIIVCATALSVADVANKCGMFLNHQKVLACYPGLDNTKLITDLRNGCNILVSTPSMLYRLLGVEIGVDLRRLTTMVFEDCERLDKVYELEVKAIQLYVRKMLKSRTDKQVKVQYILASRKWCDFMNPLAKKAPNTIVTFAAFHECVFYSKSHTLVSFVQKSKKVDAVVEFLKETDESKLAVIVCRSDDEVDLLEATLTRLKIAVVACNNQMTIHDLYKIRTEEHSSVLICCDGNLNHLNVTYANYLIHFSMPAIYSQFCARFAVLNDNYPSIFGSANENVKIKILLEESNVEQLPKILNFVTRCSYKVPEVLNEIARKVLEQKDISKAEKLVPICDSLLSLGECANDTCQERHAILKGHDEPKPWMPCNGVITFKIIQYNSAISYSARLLTHVTGGDKTKYPERYGTLCMKLGMFFSKEENKRLHGEPKVGDICAVAIRKNFIARCKVLKINNYEKGMAKYVAVNLIDEEQITVVRAVELYFLPEEFKTVETYVVKVRLASVRPQDKDVTFSELAKNKLKKITDDDEQLYMKGRVVMTISNTIFVGNLEACAELSALSETVVKYDFKNLLLNTHAIPNPDHLSELQKLCEIGKFEVKHEPEVVKTKPRIVKVEKEYRWAHLDKIDWSDVIFANTINPGKFFVRLQKFSKCVDSLLSDIKKYVTDNPEPIENVSVGDVVLAEFPDDLVYERAMIEEVIDKNRVMCFFVDNADWREVAVNKLKSLPRKLLNQIPFQSIECRLIGVKPPGDDWTDFSTNWLHDNCLEDNKGNSKRMYAKYFTKEKAEMTSGHKYGVILVDTMTEEDVVINKRMIELNLAAIKEEEIEFLEKPLDFVRDKTDTSSFEEDLDENEFETNNDKSRGKNMIPIPIKLNEIVPDEDQNDDWDDNDEIAEVADRKITPFNPKNDIEVAKPSLKNIFAENPIKSFPLINDSDEDSDKWDVCIDEDLGKRLGLPNISQSNNDQNKTNKQQANSQTETAKRENKKKSMILPAITNVSSKTSLRQTFEKDNTDDAFIKNDEATDKYESDNDKGNIDDKTTRELNYTNNIANKTEGSDTSGQDIEIQLTNNILKGEIKDVAVYDSDDTLSISTSYGKNELSHSETKKRNIKEISVLDSDDTQSMMTETDKELSVDGLKKGLSKSTLDSDDSAIDDLVEDSKETINVINKYPTNEVKNMNGKKSETFDEKLEKTIRVKGKVIPITEISKTEIATNSKNDRLSKMIKCQGGKIDKQKDENEKDIPEVKGKTITITQTVEPVRTPPIVWRQDKNTITVKIKIIVDEYTLETGNRSLKFSAYQNEVKYAFDIVLYGIIEHEKTKHSNRGQYILVTLTTMLKKRTKWLKLTKDFKNWIVYDVDSIDASSDEEPSVNNDALKIVMDRHEKAMEIDNDDEDMDDYSGYRYRDN